MFVFSSDMQGLLWLRWIFYKIKSTGQKNIHSYADLEMFDSLFLFFTFICLLLCVICYLRILIYVSAFHKNKEHGTIKLNNAYISFYLVCPYWSRSLCLPPPLFRGQAMLAATRLRVSGFTQFGVHAGSMPISLPHMHVHG